MCRCRRIWMNKCCAAALPLAPWRKRRTRASARRETRDEVAPGPGEGEEGNSLKGSGPSAERGQVRRRTDDGARARGWGLDPAGGRSRCLDIPLADLRGTRTSQSTTRYPHTTRTHTPLGPQPRGMAETRSGHRPRAASRVKGRWEVKGGEGVKGVGAGAHTSR